MTVITRNQNLKSLASKYVVKPRIRYNDRQMCRVVLNVHQGGTFRLSKAALDYLEDVEPGIKRAQWQKNLYLRSHPALVMCVQELGAKAAGRNCTLVPFMMPEGCALYRIDTSDGIERLITPRQENYIRVHWF